MHFVRKRCFWRPPQLGAFNFLAKLVKDSRRSSGGKRCAGLSRAKRAILRERYIYFTAGVKRGLLLQLDGSEGLVLRSDQQVSAKGK
jgi:hypothetical protein